MAAMLYKSGHHRAAKELLCDERAAYDEFKRAGSPCQVRPLWEEIGANGGPKLAFDPASYESIADCLTAAHAAQAPLAACQRR